MALKAIQGVIRNWSCCGDMSIKLESGAYIELCCSAGQVLQPFTSYGDKCRLRTVEIWATPEPKRNAVMVTVRRASISARRAARGCMSATVVWEHVLPTGYNGAGGVLSGTFDEHASLALLNLWGRRNLPYGQSRIIYVRVKLGRAKR